VLHADPVRSEAIRSSADFRPVLSLGTAAVVSAVLWRFRDLTLSNAVYAFSLAWISTESALGFPWRDTSLSKSLRFMLRDPERSRLSKLGWWAFVRGGQSAWVGLILFAWWDFLSGA
jgi:RimJ/RimL family protein N-acetyltransferase